MTEESADDASPPEKLMIDNPSDFQFHAAYLAYSEVYDKISDLETKKLLNDNILALQQKQMEYSAFYMSIGQYRDGGSGDRRRPSIKTQRKRDWRKKIEKRERNKRHRR